MSIVNFENRPGRSAVMNRILKDLDMLEAAGVLQVEHTKDGKSIITDVNDDNIVKGDPES